MVALYWFENLLFTYRFINDVLPTPESPKMITFNRTFLRDAILQNSKNEENKKKKILGLTKIIAY